MNIARPPGGFRVFIDPGVAALVESAISAQPQFDRYWRDILARLKFTAHVEGVVDHRFPEANRLWKAAADDDRGLPQVRLVYLVRGDQVRIRVASIG